MLQLIKLISVSGGFKLLGTAVLMCWAYYTIKIHLIRRKYAHLPGPKTKGIFGFYLGNLGEIVQTVRQGKIMVDKLLEWREEYGPVYKFQMLNQVIVFTSDKSAIKDNYITKNFPKPTHMFKKIMFPYGERYLGYGLVTIPDQEEWRQRRAVFNPGFHRHILMNFVGQFNTKADILMEKLTKLADGKTLVNLFKEINRATLDAIALIAFGMNIDSINDENSPFNKTIDESMHIVQRLLRDPVANYNPFKIKDRLRLKKLNGFLRETGREKILERLNQFKNNDTNIPNDILSNILQSNKQDSFDLEMMIDDFVTFFIAGQETTANALGFCFLEIGRNPQIFEKARKEINEVLGERTEITYQDVVKLKYCSSIFKEALRLYPPAPNLARQTTEEIEIDGYIIPSDTTVMVSTYVNGRLVKYFPNPMEYRPERFIKDLDAIDSTVEAYTYFPFALGARNCIGQNFAQIEGIIMIAKFLQRFDYRLDPTQSFKIEQTLTLRPIDGSRCFLTMRT